MKRPEHSVCLFPELPPASQEARDRLRAEHVNASQWNGGAVWSDAAGAAFESIDALRAWYAARGRPAPAYVWECVREEADACTSSHIAIDFILKDEEPGNYDAAEELREHIETWLEEHDVRLMHWVKGNKRVVVL